MLNFFFFKSNIVHISFEEKIVIKINQKKEFLFFLYFLFKQKNKKESAEAKNNSLINTSAYKMFHKLYVIKASNYFLFRNEKKVYDDNNKNRSLLVFNNTKKKSFLYLNIIIQLQSSVLFFLIYLEQNFKT